MVAVANPIRNSVVIPANDRGDARPMRYRGVLDIGVLLVTLIVFLLFLVLLIRVVFPQGSRLSEIISSRDSILVDAPNTGDLELAGSNVSNFGSFFARLGDIRREVKIRPADSIAWSNASEGTSVHNRDAVQTFAYSRARVDFTLDNELRIGENSLVVFSSGAADPFLQRREPAIVVLEGELTGVVNADYGPFAMQFPAGSIEMTAEDGSGGAMNFRVGVNPDQSSTIAVYSGQADVNIAGERYLVSANNGLTITSDGRSTGTRALPTLPPIHAPSHGTVVKYLGAPPRVKFRWGKVSDVRDYRLEIARDADFDELLVDEYLDVTSFTHGNLAPGRFFWRVSARAGWVLGPTSMPRRLSVVRDSEPPLLELQPIQHLIADNYVLRGKTAAGAKVYVLGEAVKTSSDGNFEYVFAPEPGSQSIVVESIDAVGNVAYSSQVLHVPGNSGRSD